MASWNDVQTHLRESFRLQTDEPTRVALTWAYDDGRTQKLVVRRYDHDGVDMVEFKSPFAKIGGPDPLELLRQNARLPFGAVALSSEHFIVVHNSALDALSLEAFDDLMSRVASLADELEQKHLVVDAN